ncbi:hypothetical protein BDDG_13198, partial [Blastomyces dermatitidis ATCC 18188]
TYQMTNLAEVINVPACYKDFFNRCLYISKNIIFQKDLYLADSSILTTTHNLKILFNAACKAAAVISSVTPGLLTAVLQNTLNFSELTVESDNPLTSTRNITIVGELPVRESSVRDSLEDLLIDSEITVLSILKNLTRAKASME